MFDEIRIILHLLPFILGQEALDVSLFLLSNLQTPKKSQHEHTTVSWYSIDETT